MYNGQTAQIALFYQRNANEPDDLKAIIAKAVAVMKEKGNFNYDNALTRANEVGDELEIDTSCVVSEEYLRNFLAAHIKFMCFDVEMQMTPVGCPWWLPRLILQDRRIAAQFVFDDEIDAEPEIVYSN
jgi:hypothetical protein